MEALLTDKNGWKLSYKHVQGSKKINVLFLHGTLSDKNATKSTFLEDFCKKNDLSYTAFDFLGHGNSSGKYTDGTIGVWLQNALEIIDQVTEDPLIIVGSSMGGWIMLLAALVRPERIKALIGLAAAPDFTIDLWENFSEQQKEDIKEKGVIYIPNGWTEEGDPWTKDLFEDAEGHLLLNRGSLDINCPVTLIHGAQDNSVPFETSFRIMNAVNSENVRVLILKNSGHRLSEPHELADLAQIIKSYI